MSDLQMVRGDTQVIQGTALDNAGSPITDAAATCKVTARIDPTAVTTVFTRTTTGLAAGIGQVTIQAADTSALVCPSVLFWDFEVTLAGGTVKTLDSGRLLVKADATHA